MKVAGAVRRKTKKVILDRGRWLRGCKKNLSSFQPLWLPFLSWPSARWTVGQDSGKTKSKHTFINSSAADRM